MAQKDPLIEVNRRAMEYIWNKVPKEKKDGVDYVTYVKTDIPYLYYSGLVDTNSYTLEQWEKAFEDCLGEDARYWVSHEKMLWLGRFRYHKTVAEPFDPLKMRTGKYSVERLWKIFENSIIPSCSLPKEFIKNTFDQMIVQHKSLAKTYGKELKALKEKGKEFKEEEFPVIKFEKEGGKEYIIIERNTLLNIKRLVDDFPSPRRKLELSVQNMRLDRLQKLSGMASQREKSTFEAGKDFRETTKKSLKDMLVKASEDATGGRKTTGEVINVGDVQKKRPRPTKF